LLAFKSVPSWLAEFTSARAASSVPDLGPDSFAIAVPVSASTDAIAATCINRFGFIRSSFYAIGTCTAKVTSGPLCKSNVRTPIVAMPISL
jgi:hypothetical protein